MLSTAYYFLQVVLCSAIMMGYYWMVLRNKKFHQYNRFYLIAVAILSWIVPLIKIQWNSYGEGNLKMIKLLSVVADNNSEIEAVISRKGFEWSRELMVIGLYFLVAGFLLIMMLRALYRLYELLKTHPCKNVGDVFLIITQAKGTPFSFFRYIFWNDEIDIRSESGKQILQHELTHVQQRHSIDKMLIQVMLIVGWFNPFFWLLKKEMEMIHEFIADKKAVQHGDTAALAQMLLTAVFPQQRFELTHPFFFSPIKRRLQMLTNNKNPRFSYIRRLIVLPLLAIVIVLFAFRNKEYREQHPISVKNVLESVLNNVKQSPRPAIPMEDLAPIRLEKTYRIVVNPGHGGTDVGARGIDGSTESALTLQFAKMMKDKNSNPNLEIILTRSTDEFNSVIEVAEKVNAMSPDLFISLHMNSKTSIGKNDKSVFKGAEIFVAQKEKAFDYDRSYELANWLGNSISKTGTLFTGIKSRDKGIYVLQTVQCPSVLVEAGYMTHKEELALLKTPAYQEKMVLSILRGVEMYLQQKEKGVVASRNDEGDKDDNSGIDGRFDLTKDGHNFFWPKQWFNKGGYSKLNHLVLLNGEEIQMEDIRDIPVNSIARVDIIKREDAFAIYGEKGKNGVMKIETKYQKSLKNNNPYDKFRKKYNDLAGKLILLDGKKISIEELEVVNPNDIQEIKVTKPPSSIENFGSEGKDGVIEIKTKQEYLKEKTIVQEVRLDTVYIKPEIPASFPGGLAAWASYLQRNLDKNLVKRNGGPPGKYTVKINFLVDDDGTISNVRAANDPGYGAKAEALRMIAKGPNWKPALVKGRQVQSQHEISITFFVPESA